MEYKREFFSKVKKTVIPRPIQREETDMLGQSGIAWASEATICGPNWYHNREQNLIEIYDAGPALSFRDILPKKDKYSREGLYLKLAIAYRTTENANANIRTFSGNHVNLPNNVNGSTYIDPFTYYLVTDDMTININSIYMDEKIWIQRVDWEWVSKETIFDDEIGKKDIQLTRAQKEVDAIYSKKEITRNTVKEYLINSIKNDENFAKRCLALLNNDNLFEKDIVTLYKGLSIKDA